MKKYIKSILFLPVLLFALSACDSMISDVEVPDSDPKLVVTGFLSPTDDTITIVVRKTRPLYEPTPGYDNTFPPVNNATVTLSDGLNSISVPYNQLSGAYQIKATAMPVIENNAYSLSVTTPDGYNASATCIVPEGTSPEVEITGIDTLNEYGTVSRKVSFRFRDLPGNGQYYRVAAGTIYGDEYYFNSYFYETGFERGEPFVSDKNKDEEYFIYKTWEIYEDNSPDNILYISVSLTDDNYYNYHRSINSFSGDNPFAEPTPVYSNISGGVGVFAGVNGKTTEVDLGEFR
ncbi:MAG: DUF4249 domain-containing protein [Lentimicrobium sp.]